MFVILLYSSSLNNFKYNNDFKKCYKEFGLSNKNRMKSVTTTHRDWTKKENAPKSLLSEWDGYESDSFFSGILIRYVDENNERGGDGEFINIARYN